MTNIHAAIEELEKAKAKKEKERDQDRQTLDDIGHETRSSGRATLAGRMRRHVMRRDDDMLASFGRSSIDLAVAFMASGKAAAISIPDLWKAVSDHFRTAHANDKAHHVELREHEDLSYIYATAMVGDKVRARLQQDEMELRALEMHRAQAYASGQYGPVGADFHIHKLKDAFGMRAHPVTGAIAFSENRVRTLQTEMGCTGGTCEITVFRAVPTNSLRGIHIRAADPNTDDTIKVTQTDESNKVQAAAYVLRPGVHLRLDG